MITKELVDYIRGEVAKGKTREEIRSVLISGGGWTDADLGEAFRIVTPVQTPTPTPTSVQNPVRVAPPIIPPIQNIPPVTQVKPIQPIQAAIIQPPVQTPVQTPAQPPVTQMNIIMPKGSSPASSMPPAMSSLGQKPITPSMSSFAVPSFAKMNSYTAPKVRSSHGFLKFIIILILIIIFAGAAVYFFLPNTWSSVSSHIPFLSHASTVPAPEVTTDTTPPAPTPFPVTPTVVDCGAATSPDLKNPTTYENNAVLSCLGANAFNCASATGVLNDPLFPTNVSITRNVDSSCNFTLTYPLDSTLVDVTGKALAGQSITCPVSIIKSVDTTNPNATVFNPPDTTDMAKYASQMYFYGTIGLFVQNNLDATKIASLGCTGDYINSVIASYNFKQPQTK